MKYYKNENNEIYAYPADGSGDAYIKPDLIPITEAEADELRQPPPPTPEQIQAQIVSAVQAWMDSTAQQRGYDGILSACTYATSKIQKFAAEGQACVEWRDAVWIACYELLDQVIAGEMAVPTAEELIEMLPQMEWPK